MIRSLIRSRNEILELYQEEKDLCEALLDAYEAAVTAALPRNVLRNFLRVEDDLLILGNSSIDMKRFDQVLLLAMGKASPGMAGYVCELLGEKIARGLVVRPKGADGPKLPQSIEVIEGDHPIPSESSLAAGRRIEELCAEVSEKTLVIVLLSGGASALVSMPANPVTLEDEKVLTEVLLKSGATIKEMNVVRKHVSNLKGGDLARRLSPAYVVSLILSDVPGGEVDVVGSGPTVPDPSTFRDAYEVLRDLSVLDLVPRSVKKRLEDGMRGLIEETPKPGDPIFGRVENHFIGGPWTALEAAEAVLQARGWKTYSLTDRLSGEARTIGGFLASMATDAKGMCVRRALLAAGETYVKVVGKGRGGRNQEVVLSAAIASRGKKGFALLSAGTDGIDGPTEVAGAVVTGSTYDIAEGLGMRPESYLRNNDSYSFFRSLGGHVVTGPTGTNVGDIVMALYSESCS